MMENFIGKKEKWTNKGTDRQYVADSLLYSTSCHTPTFVPNLIILSQVVAEESLTEDVHLLFTEMRDVKIENLKARQIKHQQFDFLLHNILCQPQGVYRV